MIRIPKTTLTVGSSEKERKKLAKQYDFHVTLLDDELPAKEVTVEEFLIDEYPVTNAEYAAFLEATGHPKPGYWDHWATADRADHPVVNVTGDSAAAYAKWAGKRLPTVEEWEAALEGAGGSPKPPPASGEWFPQTDARDADPNRPSRHGVKGFGQVSEWTTRAMMVAGRFPFSVLKGPSWVTEKEWGFRPQSAIWGLTPWGWVYSGFRCAADAGAKIKEAPRAVSFLKERPPAAKESAEFSKAAFIRSAMGRYLTARFNSPECRLVLYAPETVAIDNTGLIQCDGAADTEWLSSEKLPCRHAHYAVRAGSEEMQLVFDGADNHLDMEYRFANPAGAARTFSASMCVNLCEAANFFDMDGARTYIWFGRGEWIPVRRLTRMGTGPKRWITVPAPAEVPADAPAALYGVLSRDGKSVFGYGRADLGASYVVCNNFCFTCFHIDPRVNVAAGRTATVKARLYAMSGGLEELRARFVKDFGLKG